MEPDLPVFDSLSDAEAAGYVRPRLRDANDRRLHTPVHEDRPVTPDSPVRQIIFWLNSKGARTVAVSIRDRELPEQMFPPGL